MRIRASQINGCAYCVETHTRDALAAGESDARLYAVDRVARVAAVQRPRAGRARAHRRGDADLGPAPLDDAYEAAAEHFDAEELAALLYAIVTINGWNRLAVTTHMVFED